MYQFWKQPKFWIGVIIILWVAYIIGANLAQTVTIHVIPWLVQPTLQVTSIVIAAAIIGVLLTLATQYQWRRWRSSKNADVSAPAPAASSSTVA